MELKQVLEVAKFLRITTKELKKDDKIECPNCGETDSSMMENTTEDGYFVMTYQCCSPECGDTSILYQKLE